MSLINQMLRDLDSRSRKESDSGARVTTVDSPVKQSRRRAWLITAGLATLLAGTAAAWWYLPAEAPSPTGAEPEASQASREAAAEKTDAPASSPEGADPEPAEAAADAKNGLARPETAGENETTAGEADAAAGREVEAWVRDFAVEKRDGARVLRMALSRELSHRLFTLSDPHRIVLDIRGVDRAEDWSPALAALDGIDDARADLRRGDRLRIVLPVPPETGFDLSAESLDDRRRRLSLRIEAAPAESARVASAETQSEPEQNNEPAPSAAEPDPEPAADMPVKTKASSGSSGADDVKRRLSQKELADRAYRSGYNAMQAGRLRQAEAQFRKALEHQPAFGDARRALIGALDHQGRWDSIRSTAREGMRLGTDTAYYAKIYARVALERGEIDTAIRTLRQHRNEASGDAEYLALLATLYRRADRHAEAAGIYRELLSAREPRGVWWMGLGLSLEGLDRPDEALDAYRRAGESGDLPTDVSDYVTKRINALSGTDEKR